MTSDIQKRSTNLHWQGAFYYQIYPRSFHKGTLNGITEKLDYIASLGVDGIWISPFFKSPMKDFGYDVSDYRAVDPQFGTLEDFDALTEKAHALGLKIIIDLVLSHTSDQHQWFTEKPEYYVWADAKPDMFGARVPPNNWLSLFGGSAWQWHEEREQYYLHNFLPSQPDLNFHNPDVQDEMLSITEFWLKRGVDGLRLDVINFCFHDAELRDNPPRDPALGSATQFEGEDPYSAQAHIYDKSRPENLAFLKRLQDLAEEYGAFTLGEIGDDAPYERAAQYSQNGLLNTTYSPFLMSGKHKDLRASLIREPFEKFAALDQQCWPSWAFSNHDVVRAASRWHTPKTLNENEEQGFTHDPRFSQMLIALLGCLRGTAFLYQGEELGLPEAKLNFEDLQDPWGKTLWPQWQGRDGCRTPMPWHDETLNQTGHWLPIPPSHHPLSADKQESDKASTLNIARNFIKWRKTQPALINGDIEFIESENPKLLIFSRILKEQGQTQTLLCLFNLSEDTITLPPLMTLGKMQFGNYTGNNTHIGPYEFGVFLP